MVKVKPTCDPKFDEFRSKFQHDKDEIVFSKPFRRMSHKTQVFPSPESNHVRTRLTHSHEVLQIAEHIARGLYICPTTLVEAIALGHDIGHAPFGHSGERVLHALFEDIGGFSHAKHSYEIAKYELQQISDETLDGIRNHTYDLEKGDFTENMPYTPEGQIVRLSDTFAYISHDIDDALRASVINESDLNGVKALRTDDIPKYKRISDFPDKYLGVLSAKQSIRIKTMITLTIKYNLTNYGKERDADGKPFISLPPLLFYLLRKLYVEFIKPKILQHPKLVAKDAEAKNIIEKVDSYICKDRAASGFSKWKRDWLKHSRMPKAKRLDFRLQRCNFIANMTDRYILSLYQRYAYPTY